MKKLFLVSSFGDVAMLLKDFVQENVKGKVVTFIPTASVVEEVTFFVDEAKKAFVEMGIVIDELDVAKATIDEISYKIKHNDYIYVSGGNTFYLLQELKRSGADQIIIDAINDGILYIGESAGAIIVSPDIEYAKDMDDSKSAQELKNYSALGVIDFYPIPHYTNFPFAEAVEIIISKYDSKLNLCPITNDQAILVEGDCVRIVGTN